MQQVGIVSTMKRSDSNFDFYPVFVNSEHFLNCKNVAFYSSAITIQSVWRTFVARTHRIRQLYSVIVIQAVMRGCSGMFCKIIDTMRILLTLICVNRNWSS